MNPKAGSNVYNQKKQKVGRIINVIGPVDRPYLLVRPFGQRNKKQLQIIGEKLYILPDIKNKKRR
jgi:rRNA processing protein Gar1